MGWGGVGALRHGALCLLVQVQRHNSIRRVRPQMVQGSYNRRHMRGSTALFFPMVPSFLQAMALHGRKWSHVAKLVPGRTDVQCRERYMNCLNPGGRWVVGG